MAFTVSVKINDVVYDLEYDSATGKYKRSLNAPSASSYNVNAGHYYPVTLTAIDEAGNDTEINDTDSKFGTELRLYVKEKNIPTISSVSPMNGGHSQTSNPTFSFKLFDNANGQTEGFAGIDISTLKLVINGETVDNEKITKDPIDGGFQCSYTPTTGFVDGPCTYTIDVSDFDGNAATTVTATFKVDTAPPELNVTSPEPNSFTKENEIWVEGTTSDATSSPVQLDIKVAGALGTYTYEFVTVNADGSFKKRVELENGENTITVIATDKAGKVSTASVKVTLKTNDPIIKSVDIEPNTVDGGGTFTIIVEVE